MAFAHLHVHTVHSANDGLAQILNLYFKAKEIGIQGIAITDHGFMHGVPQFMRQFGNSDIKPVAGCEIYLTDHYDHRIKDENHRRYFHLVLLAKNLVGYRNLCRIVSEGAVNGMYCNKPRVCHDVLERCHEGIIALSGCIGGEIPQAILKDDLPQAEKAIEWYKNLYGDDFYLEVSCHRSKKPYYKEPLALLQEKANAEIFRLGEKNGIKVVATNDVHIVDYSDATAHEVLLCANSGKTMDDKDRLIFTGEEYLKSEQEMLEVFPDHPEAISNTMDVLDKIERYSIDVPEKLPAFRLPDGFPDEDAYLKYLAYEGLQWRCSRSSNPEFGKRAETERLNYELEVISRLGFAGYFLVAKDLVDAVRSQGHYVGIGRSLSPASLVCYVLGITDVDPLSEPFQLFERFINPDGKYFPGIELDFDSEGRKAAYVYLRNRYGVDHVSRMATFPKRSKGIAIWDAFKAYGLEAKSAGSLLEYINYPEYGFMSLKYMLDQDGPVRSWYNSCSPKERGIFDMAASIENTMLHPGIHSCAILLSDRPMTDYVPMQEIVDEINGETEYVCQYNQVSDLGPVQLNILTLHPLDIIREASEGITVPDTFDDPEVFRLFSKGLTDGIFMFESEGMRVWLEKTCPTCFSELVDLYTLYRPGVMKHFDEYLERREKNQPGQDYGDILPREETFGDWLPLYQEQILMAARYFGYSKTEASRLRKALFRRDPDLKDKHVEFVAKAVGSGHSPDYAGKVWNKLEEYGKFAFPLSHATAYVATAYRLAWLKVHHPEPFLKACRCREINVR